MSKRPVKSSKNDSSKLIRSSPCDPTHLLSAGVGVATETLLTFGSRLVEIYCGNQHRRDIVDCRRRHFRHQYRLLQTESVQPSHWYGLVANVSHRPNRYPKVTGRHGQQLKDIMDLLKMPVLSAANDSTLLHKCICSALFHQAASLEK